jgi:hypothetical protein
MVVFDTTAMGVTERGDGATGAGLGRRRAWPSHDRCPAAPPVRNRRRAVRPEQILPVRNHATEHVSGETARPRDAGRDRQPTGADEAHRSSRSGMPALRIPMTANQHGRVALVRGDHRRNKPPVVFGLRLTGRLDATLLRNALDRVARRHGSLRTYFPSDESELAAYVPRESAGWPLETVDLSPLPASARPAAELSALHRLKALFVIDRPPLLRAMLIRHDGHAVLGLAIDHAVFDGESVQPFLADFGHVYRHLAAGRDPAELDTELSSHIAFAEEEHRWLDSPEGTLALRYWESCWAGMGPYPASPLRPGDATHGSDTPATGGLWRRSIPLKALLASHGRHRRLAPTLFMFTAAALFTALRELTGATDLGVIAPASRRMHSDSAVAIGYRNNRLLLRVDTPVAAFEDVARSTRDAVLDSVEHSMMPFEVLLARLAPEWVGSKPRNPYIFLNVMRKPTPPQLPGLTAEFRWLATEDAFAALPALNISLQWTDAEEVQLAAGYNRTAFQGREVDELMARLADRITAVGT